MVTGKQTKPLPQALLRGRTGPPLPMWSQHKQAGTKDFKAATHKCHTQGLSETSPVMWLQARCTQTGSLAKQRGRCPCQFWSAANQGLSLLWGGCFGGSGHLPHWLSTCCSPICRPTPHSVTTGLSFTLLRTPPSLSISPCQVGPNTCPLSRKHEDVPALPSLLQGVLRDVQLSQRLVVEPNSPGRNQTANKQNRSHKTVKYSSTKQLTAEKQHTHTHWNYSEEDR